MEEIVLRLDLFRTTKHQNNNILLRKRKYNSNKYNTQ